jgi:hypothetical protein
MRSDRSRVARGSLLAAVLIGGVLMAAQTPPDPYKSVAEQYVKLVLAVGQHDSHHRASRQD